MIAYYRIVTVTCLHVALGAKTKTGQSVFISDFVMLDLLLAVFSPNFIDSYSLYNM